MKDYKINCVDMSDEQKRLVQDAFFMLGYQYQAISLGKYYNGEYYFTYSNGSIYRMEGEDVSYFENKNHTELTLNELLRLANMEEYMTFTKADLKTGMVVKYRGGNSYAHKYNGLSLVVGDILMQADEYGQLSTEHDNLLSDYKPDFDIVEVFEVVSAKSLETITNWQLKSLWKRPEPISAQQQAIRDGIVALEAKQQELIDQAEKIKADILKLKGM